MPNLRKITDEQNVINRCLAGEVLVLSEFLHRSGIYKLVMNTVFCGIEKYAGSAVVEELKRHGLDKLHQQVAPEQLQRIIPYTEKQLTSLSPRIHYLALTRGLGQQEPVWVLQRPVLRLLMPHDVTYDHSVSAEQFRRQYGDGRITTLRPHRDSWYSEPPDTINLWIALGVIVPGNGLSIYRQLYGQPLEYVTCQGVVREQPLCRPENYSMNSGDALVFHAEQLHASELNHSDHTRCVLSLRFVLQDPAGRSPEPLRYVRVDPRTRFSFHALNPVYARVRRRFLALSRSGPPAEAVRRDVRVFSGELQYQSASSNLKEGNSLPIDLLEPGVPLPISPAHCLVRLTTGEVYRLNRRCPHEGADLLLGNVEGNKLHCPWHNLPFDIASGYSPCTSLNGLNSMRCIVDQGRVLIPPTQAV